MAFETMRGTKVTDLYKIIVSNQSTHGGTFDWSKHLPKGSKPGKWTSPVSDVAVCRNGYHLTNNVMRWPKVGMQVYRAEGRGASSTRDDKTAFESVRLIERADDVVPDYWRLVEGFVRELPTIPWFKPNGELALDGVEFQVFETRAAAGAAAGDAAWDAAIQSRVLVCTGLDLDETHINHARARMEVWKQGYGLNCDVNGVLYCYRRPS